MICMCMENEQKKAQNVHLIMQLHNKQAEAVISVFFFHLLKMFAETSLIKLYILLRREVSERERIVTFRIHAYIYDYKSARRERESERRVVRPI